MNLKKALIPFIWLAFMPSMALAEDQPPFEIQDLAIMENFRRIYQLLDQHTHNDGTHVFISSGNLTALAGADVYASSVTVAANTSVNVAVPGLIKNLFPIFSEMNTSSKTVSCQAWASSFTLTNTSGAESKVVHWWVFGKK